LAARSNTSYEQDSLLAYTPANLSSRSSNLLTLHFRRRSLCCRCACPCETLVSFFRFSTFVPRFPRSPPLPELEIEIETHQSSGSSSISNCAAAARDLSSFDIFERAWERRRYTWCEVIVSRKLAQAWQGLVIERVDLSTAGQTRSALQYPQRHHQSVSIRIAHRISISQTSWRAKR